jgi:hypothetical protein
MSWTLWGDGDEPLAEGLTEAQARRDLDEYVESGRDDVYAENEAGEVVE